MRALHYIFLSNVTTITLRQIGVESYEKHQVVRLLISFLLV